MKYAAYATLITYALWVFYLAVMNLARDGKWVASVVPALLNALKRQGDAIAALGARIVELAA